MKTHKYYLTHLKEEINIDVKFPISYIEIIDVNIIGKMEEKEIFFDVSVNGKKKKDLFSTCFLTNIKIPYHHAVSFLNKNMYDKISIKIKNQESLASNYKIEITTKNHMIAYSEYEEAYYLLMNLTEKEKNVFYNYAYSQGVNVDNDTDTINKKWLYVNEKLVEHYTKDNFKNMLIINEKLKTPNEKLNTNEIIKHILNM